MRARVYLRNSTDKQAKAATIKAQRPECSALAKQLGVDEVIEYPEQGVSGAATLDERPKMRALLRDLQAGEYLISFALDRVSRSDDLIEQAAVYGAVQRAGASVVTVLDGAVDLSSMVGRIMLAVKSEYAAEERRKFKRRTLAGKKRAATEGRKPQGREPYGLHFSKDTKKWSLDEPAAAIVREVFARIIAGQTCNEIAAEFRARGVQVPKWGKAAAGPRFTGRRVWMIASRSCYCGEWLWNGHTIQVPAIVDRAIWQTAQAKLMEAGLRGLKRTQHEYFLDEGTGRCGMSDCGAPLRLAWGARTGDVSYYVCERRRNREGCKLPWWRTSEADALVWAEVRKMLSRPDLVEEAIRDQATDGGQADAEAKEYEAQIARLASVREVLTTQFRRGRISEAELDRELDAVARERRLLEASAEAARTSAARAQAAVAEIGSVRAYLATLADELKDADPAKRRRIVRALAPSVVVDEHRVRIGFALRDPATIALVGSTCCRTENHCETSVTVERRTRGTRRGAA